MNLGIVNELDGKANNSPDSYRRRLKSARNSQTRLKTSEEKINWVAVPTNKMKSHIIIWTLGRMKTYECRLTYPRHHFSKLFTTREPSYSLFAYLKTYEHINPTIWIKYAPI